MAKAKKWVMIKQFDGYPKESDIELVEEELPALQDGEFLVEAMFVSVDPYIRIMMKMMPEGTTVLGEQISKVVESKWAEYPVGTVVWGHFGWRTHSIVSRDHNNQGYGKFLDNVSLLKKIELGPRGVRTLHFGKVPEFITQSDLPLSVRLGVLGMPGCTAYFGLLRLCDPKPGEVVLVNGGAGAVGSVVGQLAKIKGCTVIGYAGSDAKCQYMKSLGFDHVYNYKTTNLAESLKQAAPNGVDCFFDNVGGKFLEEALHNHMNDFGRIVLCGSISTYNRAQNIHPDVVGIPSMTMSLKLLSIFGLVVYRWANEWDAAAAEMLQWIKQGKLKFKEHVTEGFENLPKAFLGVLTGENTGKAVVKCV